MTSPNATGSADVLTPDAVELAAAKRGGFRGRLSSLAWRALLSPEISLVIAIVVLGAIIQSQNPVFLTFDNLILVLKAASPTFVMAVGMTFVLIAGGIDLSVGSMSALGGVIAAWALTAGGMPIPVAVFLSLVACTAIGVIFGTLISRARIPALIVTLGGLYAVRGVVLIGTGGVMIFPLPDEYNHLGQGSLFGIPLLVIYAAIIGVAAHVLLEHSSYGFHVRAVGGNITAARAAGINVRRITTSVFALSAAGAALGGMMISAKTAVGDSASGQGTELAVITSVIVGGASLFGAVGSIAGTTLGVVLIAMITNGLLLMRISSYWQFLVLGIVIVAAVGVDSLRRRFAWSR